MSRVASAGVTAYSPADEKKKMTLLPRMSRPKQLNPYMARTPVLNGGLLSQLCSSPRRLAFPVLFSGHGVKLNPFAGRRCFVLL